MKGDFERSASLFRDVIPSPRYPAESGRYVLYANYLCPWAHRTLITRVLKGLESIVDFIEVDTFDKERGWLFSGIYGPDHDPINGVKTLRELYEKVRPGSLESGIASVPVLFDKKTKTIVNNESGEIIRMLYTAFDDLLPLEDRECKKGELGLLPPSLEHEIEEMNAWIYDSINNGVYKAGFATTIEAYDANVPKLYAGFDRLEEHLQRQGPFLFGKNVTETDIRLYPTILRFDIAYAGFFTRRPGDVHLIRAEYPHIHMWLRALYWDQTSRTREAFSRTVDFHKMREGSRRVPNMGEGYVAPEIDILPLDDKE